MIARIVNQAADVIHRAQVNGAQTAAGMAIALESARLLVSDEMVHEMAALEAERDALQARVAELLAERHSTNESLDTAVRELRTPYAERARRETHPGRRQAWRMLAQIEESEREAGALLTPLAERSADRLTRMFAPTQALQSEGEHYAATHHAYRVGRDLPEPGGVS